jgi:hypothetical protein
MQKAYVRLLYIHMGHLCLKEWMDYNDNGNMSAEKDQLVIRSLKKSTFWKR